VLAGLYRTGEIDKIYETWLAALGRSTPLLRTMYPLNGPPE